MLLLVSFFLFKQKTAYEMRISDWSSDVCSSDLIPHGDGRNNVDVKRVGSGLLMQDSDNREVARDELKVAGKRAPSDAELDTLLFAWRVAKFVKSNAIVYAKGQRTIGIGAGQMSRVVSAKIAGLKAEEAGLVVPGSVMASDAFFPFRDGIDAAAAAGIRAVIQPGGPMREQDVVAAAARHALARVLRRKKGGK